MTKSDLLNYVQSTPENLNPRIFRAMVDKIATGSGEENGIQKVDTLPDIAEEGDLVFVKNNKAGKSLTFSELIAEKVNNIARKEGVENWVLLAYQLYAEDASIVIDNLTEEQKTEAREKFIKNIVDEEFDELEEFFLVSANKTPNIELNLEDLIIDTSTDNDRKIYTPYSEIIFGGIEHISSKFDYTAWSVGIVGNPTEDSGRYYIPFKDGYLGFKDADFLVKNENISEPFAILAHELSPMGEYDEQDDPSLDRYFIYDAAEDKTSIYLRSFYLTQNGTYSFYWDDGELSEINVTTPGQYGIVIEYSGKVSLEMFINDEAPEPALKVKKIPDEAFVDTTCNSFGFFKDYIEKIETKENGEITNIYDTVADIYPYQENGLFIYQNKEWNKIFTGEATDKYAELFSTLSKEYDFDKQNMTVIAHAGTSEPLISFNPDTNNLIMHGICLNEDGTFDKKYTFNVNLSSLKGEDLRIRRIERYSNGDNDQDDGIIHTCYRAFYTNGNSIGGEESYFDFYVDIPKAKEETIDPNNYLRKIYFSNYPLSTFLSFERNKYSVTNVYSIDQLATEMQESEYQDLEFNEIRMGGISNNTIYIFIQNSAGTDAAINTVNHFSEFPYISKTKLDSLEARIAALEKNT